MIIQAAGIDFTREEFEQVVAEMTAQSGQDLTSGDLDEISSGVSAGLLIKDPNIII